MFSTCKQAQNPTCQHFFILFFALYSIMTHFEVSNSHCWFFSFLRLVYPENQRWPSLGGWKWSSFCLFYSILKLLTKNPIRTARATDIHVHVHVYTHSALCGVFRPRLWIINLQPKLNQYIFILRKQSMYNINKLWFLTSTVFSAVGFFEKNYYFLKKDFFTHTIRDFVYPL